jgi:hypothetical protein
MGKVHGAALPPLGWRVLAMPNLHWTNLDSIVAATGERLYIFLGGLEYFNLMPQ